MRMGAHLKSVFHAGREDALWARRVSRLDCGRGGSAPGPPVATMVREGCSSSVLYRLLRQRKAQRGQGGRRARQDPGWLMFRILQGASKVAATAPCVRTGDACGPHLVAAAVALGCCWRGLGSRERAGGVPVGDPAACWWRGLGSREPCGLLPRWAALGTRPRPLTSSEPSKPEPEGGTGTS